MNDDGVICCQRCGKNLISEEFENHVCRVKFLGIKQIYISSYFKGKKDENGDDVIIAKGLDGFRYWLIKCDHNPPHQPKVNTNNTTDKETVPK